MSTLDAAFELPLDCDEAAPDAEDDEDDEDEDAFVLVPFEVRTEPSTV